MTLIEKFNEVAELANVAPIPEVFGLSAKEFELANLEAEADEMKRAEARDVLSAQQDSKRIDWAEFDKLDQIIMSSND